MNYIELTILALALATDAFAVSVCLGLGMKRATWGKSCVVGAYFGVFQALMPLIGYLVANLFAGFITTFSHWIAFGLLLILGAKMIYEALEKDKEEQTEPSLGLKTMLPFALATSIDALAVGVSFALIKVDIVPAVSLIGAITFFTSVLGVKLGSKIGLKFKAKAELAGGIVLILIGIKIVLSSYGVINF